MRSAIADLFEANKRRYGYRRIRVALQRTGLSVSEKIIRRIMAEEGLTVLSSSTPYVLLIQRRNQSCSRQRCRSRLPCGRSEHEVAD